MPSRYRFVQALSAARAIGLIERDGSRRTRGAPQYAGVLLDHDLHLEPLNATDRSMNGQHVAKALAGAFSPDVPIFIHSTNDGGSAAMMTTLKAHGFDVVRTSMLDLQQDNSSLLEWLDDVLEIWEDSQE